MGLFDNVAEIGCFTQDLGPGAVLLPGFALSGEALLLTALHKVIVQAPFRHMATPGGFRMSVAMTNCGTLGWISDEKGYRYDDIDPDSGRSWPPMPDSFLKLASGAAEKARLPAIQARCLSHQSLPDRREAFVASGQE